MKFGAHVSIAGGMPNAPANAAALGCEIFQFFSRSPRGGKAAAITKEIADNFQSECKKYKQAASYIHAPYYINFASENNRIRFGSISIIRDELERASALGVKAIMTHLGSAKDTTPEEAIKITAQGIAKALKGYKGSAKLLLELSAGSGLVIGATFEDMAAIINGAESSFTKATADKKNIIGVCLDTAHVFASGYDLRTKKAVDDTLKLFDKTIGLSRLGVIHANDSMVDLGEKKDRHEHIGQGKIGLAGFKALVNHPKLKNIDMIVETPTPEGMKKDIALFKKIRG